MTRPLINIILTVAVVIYIMVANYGANADLHVLTDNPEAQLGELVHALYNALLAKIMLFAAVVYFSLEKQS